MTTIKKTVRAGIAMAALLLMTACGTTVVRDPQVVDIGYGLRLKDNMTTSVSTSDDAVIPVSEYQSIYDYLATIPGIIVNGTGSTRSIHIRGISTIYGSTDPLILINGVECNDISSVHPREVERVSVLKDAASCAIYGVRGSNGVILITTKR